MSSSSFGPGTGFIRSARVLVYLPAAYLAWDRLRFLPVRLTHLYHSYPSAGSATRAGPG